MTVRGYQSAWTAARVETLTKLWDDGKTCSQIAAEMGGGLTRNSVIGKVHRLGLPGRAVATRRPPEPRPKPAQPRASAAPSAVPMLAPINVPLATPKRLLGAPAAVLGLSNGQCRWPIGHPHAREFKFCCAAVKEGGSYCGEHHAIAYSRGMAA